MPEFRVVDRALLAPGRCFICGETKGGMLDTGLRERLPWGAIYICVLHCVASINQATGAVSRVAHRSVTDKLAYSEAKSSELAAELQRLRPLEELLRENVPLEA